MRQTFHLGMLNLPARFVFCDMLTTLWAVYQPLAGVCASNLPLGVRYSYYIRASNLPPCCKRSTAVGVRYFYHLGCCLCVKPSTWGAVCASILPPEVLSVRPSFHLVAAFNCCRCASFLPPGVLSVRPSFHFVAAVQLLSVCVIPTTWGAVCASILPLCCSRSTAVGVRHSFHLRCCLCVHPSTLLQPFNCCQCASFLPPEVLSVRHIYH